MKLAGWTAAALAASAAALAGGAAGADLPGVVLTHPLGGHVKLGVLPAGSLNYLPPVEDELNVPSVTNVRTVGLRYVDREDGFGLGAGAEFESTAPGTLNEGWGVSYTAEGATGAVEGGANAESGVHGLEVQPLEVNEACGEDELACVSARATAQVGDCLRVVHSYTPVEDCEWAFCVEVNLTNLCAAPIHEVRYGRVMDWDVEPTPFEEKVTLHPGTAEDLECLSEDRHCTGLPSEEVCAGGERTCAERGTATETAPPVGDRGAMFRFNFKSISEDEPLAQGQTRTMTTFYGAAPSPDAAEVALEKLGVEAFSLARPSGALPGEPDVGPTHFFGFVGISGPPVVFPPAPPVPPVDGDVSCDCERATATTEGRRVGITFHADADACAAGP